MVMGVSAGGLVLSMGMMDNHPAAILSGGL